MWEGISERMEGSSVILEPLKDHHMAPLWAAAKDPEIWHWMPLDAAENRESFCSWFEEGLGRSRAGTEAAFAIVDAGSGDPVGSTRYLALRPEHRVLEIGWTWLSRRFWRTETNADAKLLMLGRAFERLGCRRVEFKTDARNQRSRAALAALPARFEGVFRKHMLVRGGESRDSAYYSVIDEEWPEVKAALERRIAAAKTPNP